jgi:hypothetical protein
MAFCAMAFQVENGLAGVIAAFMDRINGMASSSSSGLLLFFPFWYLYVILR